MTAQREPPPEPTKTSRPVVRRVLWLFVGTIATFVTFLVLSKFNVTGIREDPPEGKPGISFRLNESGGVLLAEVTRKNVPSVSGETNAPVKRHMAIILDGQVMSAPTINSEISSDGLITGEFSDEELDNLVNILRAGLPGGPRLQAHPVEEKTIDNGKIPGAGGGAVLVYQIIPQGKDVPTPEEKAHLTESLKQFLDRNGAQVTVRPILNDQIEILVSAKGKLPPAKGLTIEEVKRIKRLVSKAGLLEFRILANSEDDKAAIEDAMKLIDSGMPEVNKALEQAQLKGLTPPGPRTQGVTGEPKVYDLVLAKGAKSRVTYSWVELGPAELRQMKLDAASKDDPKRKETWKEAAKFRGKATTLAASDGAGQKLLQGALFYSRECKDQNLPEEELAAKPFEYFVLARNPEIDAATGKATPRIDSSYLVSAYKIPWPDDPYYRSTRVRADFIVLAVVAALGSVAFFLLRRWVRLRWEFLIGHGVALAIAVIVVLIR